MIPVMIIIVTVDVIMINNAFFHERNDHLSYEAI